jgi:uncharacterized protein YbjT (DUF2867 family)
VRIFLAGATGVIGRRLLPLLLAEGHTVAAMTRSPEKAAGLAGEPVVCDVFDRDALIAAVAAFAPDLVMHQLTDLPDRLEELADHAARNDRMRSEGTANLVAAADGTRVLAQSIAWTPPGRRGEVVAEHERQVLDAGGVVVRYGQFYGPGTFYEGAPPDPPRIHVDEAARRTVELLGAPTGVVVVA